MIYALDSNILSYVINKNPVPTKKLNRLIQEECIVVLPLITYYEVRRGLVAVNATTKMHLFEQLCATIGIESLTIQDMNTAALIYSQLKKQGKPIEDADLLIAAQCLTRNYALVTANTKHFEIIDGLTVVDWTV
ncbi:MAG: PIN domain-containing protein [Defluviitaleaceae bacterium]|nr:PIN domain-containing protein [Defluviitaleaceae bacterium]